MSKKIKKITLSVAILIGILFVTIGCSRESIRESFVPENTIEYTMEDIGWINPDIKEYKDTETGVHYFVYFGMNGRTGMTLRYNADGTPYTD